MKMHLIDMEFKRVDLIGSGYSSRVNFCEHDNYLSVSLEVGNCLTR
jgi:hypothetical protein